MSSSFWFIERFAAWLSNTALNIKIYFNLSCVILQRPYFNFLPRWQKYFFIGFRTNIRTTTTYCRPPITIRLSGPAMNVLLPPFHIIPHRHRFIIGSSHHQTSITVYSHVSNRANMPHQTVTFAPLSLVLPLNVHSIDIYLRYHQLSVSDYRHTSNPISAFSQTMNVIRLLIHVFLYPRGIVIWLRHDELHVTVDSH